MTEEYPMPSEERQGPKHAAPWNWRRSLYDTAEILVTSLLLVGILFACLFRTAGVDGESMKNTLQDGDYLVLYRLLYQPQRGDIVVINRYHAQNGRVEEPLIKRVIGVAGDTVEVTEDAVYLNGEMLEESYDLYYDHADRQNRPTCEKLTVPEGKLFVMGDHRDNSKDSRSIGCVDVEDVMGKAVWRISPDFGGLYG